MTDTVLTFGKYKGKKISQVPDDYLLYILRQFDKSFWLEEAVKELIRINAAQPHEIANGKVVSMRIALPNGRFEIVQLRVPVLMDTGTTLNPEFTKDKNGMPVQTVGIAHGFTAVNKPLEEPVPDVPPAPPKEGFAASMLVQQAKLSGDMTASQQALQFLQSECPAELAVLSDNVKHAATRFGQEAVIYGAMEEEKWLRVNQECRVKYLYLDLRWEFSLVQGCIPQLEQVERISS